MINPELIPGMIMPFSLSLLPFVTLKKGNQHKPGCSAAVIAPEHPGLCFLPAPGAGKGLEG
jgi:hypothetical protein